MPSRLCAIPLNLYVLTVTLDSANVAARKNISQLQPALKAINCSVQPMSAAQQDFWGRRGLTVNTTIFTDYDIDTNLPGGLKKGMVLVDPATGWGYQVDGFQRSANPRLRLRLIYEIQTHRVIL